MSAPRFPHAVAAAWSAVNGSRWEEIHRQMVEALTEVEREVKVALAGEDLGRIACSPGCPACCTVHVSVLFPEAAAIAWQIRDLTEAGRRVAETASKVRWMEDGERIRRGISCPFLDPAGSCSIYPLRPLLCRGITSTDAAQCREALCGDDEEAVIELNLLQKYLYDEAFAQFAATLDGRGIDSRSFELCAAVSAILHDPRLLHLFAAGEKLPPLSP